MEAVYRAEVKTKDGRTLEKKGGLVECSEWVDEKLAENKDSCAQIEKIA